MLKSPFDDISFFRMQKYVKMQILLTGDLSPFSIADIIKSDK
jgi:hypothetical protein